jgi:hypothetical protein
MTGGVRTAAATASIAELLKASPDWRRFFKACCEAGALRLRAQAWQFRDELREHGKDVALQEVEDALLTIARKVLPMTLAASWDPEWAAGLVDDALSRLSEHYAELLAGEREVLDLSGQEVWEERIHAAGLNNDPAAFRQALRGWEKATAEALEAARGEARSGAA